MQDLLDVSRVWRWLSAHHTVDHDTFIKSQLASTQLTLGPCVVQFWSPPPPQIGLDVKCWQCYRIRRRELSNDPHATSICLPGTNRNVHSIYFPGAHINVHLFSWYKSPDLLDIVAEVEREDVYAVVERPRNDVHLLSW